jgi:hypothetical protein
MPLNATTVPTNGQLVVDLPHLDQLTGQLAELSVHPTQPPEIDEALGLALLRLPTEAAALIARLRSTEFAASAVLGTNPPMANTRGVINPDPETKPHPYVLPPPAGHGVHVGALHASPARDTRPTPLGAYHAEVVTSLVTAQATQATVVVRNVPVDATGRTTAWDVARAMLALADAGVDVINLSVSCDPPHGEPPLPLRCAVELLSPRVVPVAAAGDRPTCEPTWPAGVVVVGARKADESLADFSPRAPWVTCTAPGDTWPTTTVPPFDFEGYVTWSGTAFAAATASGAIAAHTVPGQVTARDALAGLLAGDGGVVRKYLPGDDGQRA